MKCCKPDPNEPFRQYMYETAGMLKELAGSIDIAEFPFRMIAFDGTWKDFFPPMWLVFLGEAYKQKRQFNPSAIDLTNQVVLWIEVKP